jgi:DNA-binding transcriptional regulator YiaG
LISGAKTVGDWICAGRAAHNLARHHVAEKMGIASALVAAWEKGAEQPSGRQVEILRELFKESPVRLAATT